MTKGGSKSYLLIRDKERGNFIAILIEETLAMLLSTMNGKGLIRRPVANARVKTESGKTNVALTPLGNIIKINSPV